MSERPVAPDDTQHENRGRDDDRLGVSAPASTQRSNKDHAGRDNREAGSEPADSHTTAVAPDDTPTRLPAATHHGCTGPMSLNCSMEIHHHCSGIFKTADMENLDMTHQCGCWCHKAQAEATELRADVSRLQQEHTALQQQLKSEKQERLIWSNESKILVREKQTIEAERAKLLEENALLRRSLEMLTKQLDEKDKRIDELVGIVGEVD